MLIFDQQDSVFEPARLANAGATADEIRTYISHATNNEGSTYTANADRAQLADSRLAKLDRAKSERIVSSHLPKLDKGMGKQGKSQENSACW